MSRLIGVQIGDYRVVSTLGKGGMGEVFLAEDTRLRRRVALKFLPAEQSNDPDRFERLVREARAASALNHPNIVTIYHIGDSDAGRFIAMEYIAGKGLRTVIAERPPVETAMTLVAQVAKALACAHAAGIVHRDIKPANIMVRDDGYVKVLDFGLARRPELLDANMAAALSLAITSTGPIVGTVRYMSPEQAAGKPLSVATDVFSLGVVLYETVTGRHPITADSPLAHIAALATEVPLSPSRYVPEIPEQLDNLILEMLARDPERRPTAAEVAGRLAVLAHSGSARVRTRLLRQAGVGRQTERRALRAAFDRVVEGRSGMMLVAGEPGLGKTTLVEDFLSELATQEAPPRIGRGRCLERMAGTGAYLPIVEVFQHLITGADNAAVHLSKTLAPSWYGQIVTDTGSGEGHAAAMPTTPEQMKREFAALLHDLSRDRPLVLFLDDLQWVDASTLDVVSYFLDRNDPATVLVLGTYRPTEVSATAHLFSDRRLDLISRGVCEELSLGFLTSSDVDRYVALTFTDHLLPEAFSELVYSRTEGHPLFMAELLRYFRDRGTISIEGGVWKLTQAVEVLERAIPQSVKSMVERKVDQLSEAERQLLVAASVQGEQFDVVILSSALSVAAADLEEQFERLERVRGFVKLLGEEELPDGTLTARYQFAHALYHDVLYDSLRPARRAALSRCVAEALLHFHRDRATRLAGQLGLLYEMAREFEQAMRHFLIASSTVLERGGPAEAAELARRGVALIGKLPASDTRDRLDLQLRLALGSALTVTTAHRSEEVMVAFDKAREVAQRLGQHEAVFQALAAQVWSHIAAGPCARARELADECMRQAEVMQDPKCRAGAHLQVGVTNEYLGELRTARFHYRQAIDLSDNVDQDSLARLFMLHPAVYARSELANSLFHGGQFTEAFAMMNEALRLAHTVKHPVSTGLVLTRKLNLSFRSGRLSEAAAYVEEFARLQREVPNSQVIWLPLMQGWLEGLREGGFVDKAERLITESIARCEAIGYRTNIVAMKQILAEILMRCDRLEKALEIVQEGLREGENVGELQYMPELLRLGSDITLRMSWLTEAAFIEAEESLRKAIRLADESGGGLWALRATTTLARRLTTTGRSQESLALLHERCKVFEAEHEDVADLTEARSCLSTLTMAQHRSS